MKPYTKTFMDDTNDLRRNGRGNLLSKGRNGDKDGKGMFKLKIGSRNYHRKKMDRQNKKRYRHKFKDEIKKQLNEEY